MLPADLRSAADTLDDLSAYLGEHYAVKRRLSTAWETFDELLSEAFQLAEDEGIDERARDAAVDAEIDRREDEETSLYSAWDALEARLCDEF